MELHRLPVVLLPTPMRENCVKILMNAMGVACWRPVHAKKITDTNAELQRLKNPTENRVCREVFAKEVPNLRGLFRMA